MELLYTLLIVVLIAAVIYYIVTVIPLPQPFKNIVLIVLGVMLLIYLLGLLFGAASFPRIR